MELNIPLLNMIIGLIFILIVGILIWVDVLNSRIKNLENQLKKQKKPKHMKLYE